MGRRNLPIMHSFYALFAHNRKKPLRVRYKYTLMLFREKIFAYSENHADYLNTLSSEIQIFIMLCSYSSFKGLRQKRLLPLSLLSVLHM
jgi:hypothetical protein